MVRNDTLRMASTLALVGGILCTEPESAVAAQPTGNVPQTTGEPDPSAADTRSSGIPRTLLYGAVAGLFLLVAGGLGAHKKH